MNTLCFYVATFLALVYAAIVFAEAHENQALEKAMTTQRTYQIKLLRAEENNQFTHHVVQRIAADAATDPALASVLKENGVQISYNRPSESTNTNPANP